MRIRGLIFLGTMAAISTPAWGQWRSAPTLVSLARPAVDYGNGNEEAEYAFPVEKIQQLRRRAEKARSLPGGVPEGWSKSPVDPMQVLQVFDCLHIKNGLTLRSYLYDQSILSTGQVWAIRVDAAFPEPNSLSGFPPKPLSALDHVMDGITGDGSPWSYLCASILSRELAEFGARWHGCNWTTHTLIGADPLISGVQIEAASSGGGPNGYAKGELPTAGSSGWKWLSTKPNPWHPSVRVSPRAVTVIFFTYSPLGQEGIYRHADTYVTGSYTARSESVRVAEGPRHMVF
jgi:hypothetical protein